MKKRAMSQGIIFGIVVGVIVLVAIGVFLILSGKKNGSPGSVSRLSGEEKEVEYGAEVACLSYGFSQEMDALEESGEKDSATQQFTKDLAAIVDKYGFTMTEAQELSMKYSEDKVYFNKVLERVKVLCPGGYSELKDNPPEAP